MAGVNCTYISTTSFSISGTDYTGELMYGRRLLCDCSPSGDKAVTINNSSWSDPLTTVNLIAADSQDLNSSLSSFRFGPGVSTLGSVSARGLDHNKLSDIDGGNSTNAYHLSASEYTDLTDGGDCTIHDHDGISENTAARHTQGTDTTLGTMTADIDMNSSYQVVNLQAPAAAGEALRQTVNITEADLETLNDNSIADALHRHSELVASDGSPDPALSIDANGDIDTNGIKIQINSLGSGNRFAYIDLVGDDTHTNYGLRIIRSNTGADTDSYIYHRGDGSFIINAQDDGDIKMYTASIGYGLSITSAGKVYIGNTSPTEYFEYWPDGDVAAILGRARVGLITGAGDYAGFCHLDQNAVGSYALLQASTGHTYINAPTGTQIFFRINNADIAQFAAGGMAFADGNIITIDEIRARDSGGLLLRDDSGTLGITIADGGAVSIPTSLTCAEKLVIPLNEPTSLVNGCIWIA